MWALLNSMLDPSIKVIPAGSDFENELINP